jgi:toxin ParE1/3/4
MSFKILFDKKSKEEIQAAIKWYNQQKKGLGREFYRVLRSNIDRLQHNPYFQIRYDNVRCLPIRKYPFMIHFTIDELSKIVFVRAILNTSMNPDIWKDRE